MIARRLREAGGVLLVLGAVLVFLSLVLALFRPFLESTASTYPPGYERALEICAPAEQRGNVLPGDRRCEGPFLPRIATRERG